MSTPDTLLKTAKPHGDHNKRVAMPLWMKLLVSLFSLLILIGGGLFVKVVSSALKITKNVDTPLDLVLELGSNLDKDENGQTNILLFGSGGKNWDEGTDLTDSIMVASINEDTGNVVLVSIPRDLYVQIPGYGWSRLNYLWPFSRKELPPDAVPDMPKEVIEGITGLKIHYVLKVDFSGFTKIIDAIGGIDVEVENSFRDTMYPTEDYRYQTVEFEAGPNHFDGDTALKYVRSRHAPGVEGTDFARSRRQQLVLQAIRSQLLSQDLLDDEDQISELINIVNQHYVTDLTLAQDLSLAKVAKKASKDQIVSVVLSTAPGGMLMEPTPEQRDVVYGGAFVIVPIDPSYDTIHRYITKVIKNPEILKDPAKVTVLNGTMIPGLASRTANVIETQQGYDVVFEGNTVTKRDYQEILIVDMNKEYTKEAERLARLLGGVIGILPIDEVIGGPEDSDIVIIMGSPESDTAANNE